MNDVLLWFLNVLVSAVVSAVVGFAVGWYFARRGSDELRQEAETLRTESKELRHLITTLMRGLENEGMVEWARDESGAITGIIIHASATAVGTSFATATGLIIEANQAEGDDNPDT